LPLPAFPAKLAAMKRLLPLMLALSAGCSAVRDEPYNPVEHFQYGAISHDPFWLVSIGDDKIVLTLGPSGGRADGELNSFAYPRALPRTVNGVRRWESGEGTQVIAIEARPGPCTTGGRTYADRTIVYLSGRTMTGCGGPEVVRGRG
jgi:uncharacterized membrane protein